MYKFDREKYDKRMQWFTHDRFGMFIHWGLYAIPARGEWVRSTEEIPEEDYIPFFNEFNPKDFDPKKWARLAKQAGIKDDRIVLDPGVGFGKTYEMNLEVIRNLSAFKRFGYPVLLGASRKSVIGLALDLPVDKREEGTLVTTAAAVFSGCSFVRVHDVEGNKRAVRMARAIMGAPEFK